MFKKVVIDQCVWEFVWTNLPFEKSFPSSTSPCAPFSPISLKNTRDGVPDLDSGPVVTSTKYNTPEKKQTLFLNVNLTLLKKKQQHWTSKLHMHEYFMIYYRWVSPLSTCTIFSISIWKTELQCHSDLISSSWRQKSYLFVCMNVSRFYLHTGAVQYMDCWLFEPPRKRELAW